MAISMYSASVPVFLKMLGNMQTWLGKAAAFAETKKFDPNTLLTARLAPDMLPFKNQIQIACDSAKLGVARLAAAEAPKFEDNEATLKELEARIAKTIDYLKTVKAEQVDGSEERPISVPRRTGEPLQFTGEAYLKGHALPNFFFHATMTYALLRHNGVDLGKADYLGGR
ncbi:DUF1993 domain-containing protein [Aggregicoccus sp. 17bor-14]|uniref:DUF1993 domain-containing protein n=1 Tax=Myxococcaceae TaxID=31 RepID=UPI00129C6E13|nr:MULTISPECIES: DUF1993 domain-containing protein [Myxococcaceae]MBF5041806.1 DUF1993 domain-containing protein [Simulacricoccus sp. 17bor-14]MRI87587.1 DUF1993 domain-containing protein [Aggregicoccus sp. 17bor-14]